MQEFKDKFKNDPILLSLAERVVLELGELPEIVPLNPEQYFGDLVESIVGQQLSTKAAARIREKFALAIGGKITPETIITADVEIMRQAGLSYSKASYAKNLAEAWQNGSIDYHKFSEISDEEIIAQLIQVKGIGRWTAEMFLIFGLGRPDVYSIGDYGLLKGIMKAYSHTEKPSKEIIIDITSKWSPHKSSASRVLWKSLELNN